MSDGSKWLTPMRRAERLLEARLLALDRALHDRSADDPEWEAYVRTAAALARIKQVREQSEAEHVSIADIQRRFGLVGGGQQTGKATRGRAPESAPARGADQTAAARPPRSARSDPDRTRNAD